MIRDNWSITWFGMLVIVLLAGGFTAVIVQRLFFTRGLLFGLAGGAIIAISIYGERNKRLKQITQPVSGFITAVGSIVVLLGLALTGQAYYETVIAGSDILQSVESIQGLFGLVPDVISILILYNGMVLLGAGGLFVLTDRIDGDNRVEGTTSLDLIFFILLVILVAIMGVGDMVFEAAKSVLAGISIVAMLGSLLSSGTGFDGVITGVLLIVTYMVTARAWKRLPIASLVPRRHKDLYDSVASYETYLRFGLIPLLGLVLIVDGIVGIPQFPVVLTAIQAPVVREMLFEVLAVSAISLIIVRLIRTFTKARTLARKYGTYVVYLGLLYLASTPLGIMLEAVLNVITRTELPFTSTIENGSQAVIEFMGGHEPVALAVFALILLVGISIKVSLRTLEVYGFVPPGLDGTAFIALAIFLVSIGMGLRDETTLLLIGTALTLIIWENGKRTTELGREIGRTGTTIQSQAVFLAGSVVLGVVGIILGTQAITVFDHITLQQSESLSALLALFVFTGIVFVVIALRTHLRD